MAKLGKRRRLKIFYSERDLGVRVPFELGIQVDTSTWCILDNAKFDIIVKLKIYKIFTSNKVSPQSVLGTL